MAVLPLPHAAHRFRRSSGSPWRPIRKFKPRSRASVGWHASPSAAAMAPSSMSLRIAALPDRARAAQPAPLTHWVQPKPEYAGPELRKPSSRSFRVTGASARHSGPSRQQHRNFCAGIGSHSDAGRNRRASGDVQDRIVLCSQVSHERGSGPPPAAAVRCECGARRQACAVPQLHRTLPSGAARGGSFRRTLDSRDQVRGYRPRRRPAIYTRAGFDWTRRFKHSRYFWRKTRSGPRGEGPTGAA